MVLRNKNLRDENPGREGIGLQRRTRRRSRLEFGVIGEAEGLMAATGSGALKLGPSHSVLLSIGQDVAIAMRLSMDLHAGLSAARRVSDSLVRGRRCRVR